MSLIIEILRYILRKLEEQDVQGFFDLDLDFEVYKYLGNNFIKIMDQVYDMIVYV